MSRNLCRITCGECNGEVKATGPRHEIRLDEAGRYFDAYKGMVVADAECSLCGALYLAWCDERDITGSQRDAWVKVTGHGPEMGSDVDGFFHDLSYRSTFNDEPGPADLPVWVVDALHERRVCPIWLPEEHPYWSSGAERDRAAWLQRRALAIESQTEESLARYFPAAKAALSAVLLFHSAGVWTPQAQAEWVALTGSKEATTRDLFDIVRWALKGGRLSFGGPQR